MILGPPIQGLFDAYNKITNSTKRKFIQWHDDQHLCKPRVLSPLRTFGCVKNEADLVPLACSPSQAKGTKSTSFLTCVRNEVDLVPLGCEDG